MLISRKLTKDKRVVTDFRHLNVRIAKNNLAYILVRDTFSVLGSSKCEVLSVLDLKDACHSLRLSENSKWHCGILPYFGSASYLYQRMTMGLNIFPSICQSYIHMILDCLQSRKYCEAIMDDLILFTVSKTSHMDKLEGLLRALLKHGLKISPKKCQLFRTNLHYMGNEIFIQNKRVCVQPLRSRLETIQKLQPPTMVKGCRSFVGMVNFLSMFCPVLQKLLKPIYDLTRKGKPFIWGREQQDSFEEIKHRLIKPPVLHMPNKTGRFHLYSNTSNFATGSALYQKQNGKPKLIAYASTRLPEAMKSYFITKLELCSMAINIASFSHLLKRVDFHAIVDNLALKDIIKNKVEPATTIIKILLQLNSSYSFNLYYMKGKDMILSDFLSRQKNDDSNPHDIIPMSFNMCQILDDNYSEKYLIQTRSQAKSSGIKLLEVHGVGKNLDPNLKPEKQHAIPKQGSMERPHIGQGRAGSRRKRPDPINQPINQPSNLSQKIPGRTEIETGETNHVHTKDLMHSINNASHKMTNNNPLIPDIPFHPGPVYRPLSKPIKQDVSYPQSSQSSSSIGDINPYINFD